MKKISLNGIWNFTKDELRPDNYKEVNWEQVTVPYTWNGADGQNGGTPYYRGLCWFQKDLQIEEHDGRVFLEFEGVNSVATVVLNGQILGTHKGGYSTFRFDVTDKVKPGSNHLLVGADNKHDEAVYPLMADFTFYGGIYRDSYVVYTNNVSFDLDHVGTSGVYVSQKNITKENASFTVDSYLKNYGSETEVTVQISLLDDKGSVVLDTDVSTNIKEKGLVSVDLDLTNPHLWNGVEDPYLYTVKVKLIKDGVLVDQREIPTGFRFYHFDDKAFYLNGKLTRLYGVSRHQDRIDVGNALTKEMHDEDMALIKEVGANTIRLAHYQQTQYFYDLCDKEGMIVWAEIPYISVSSKTDHSGANAKSQMEELVKQNYNHSSIVMWGIQNEIEIQGIVNNIDGILQELNDLTKSWDPYRVTTQAHVMLHPVDNKTVRISDINAYNKYYGWYMGETGEFADFLKEWREAQPNRPICLSEYGAEGIIKYHSDTPVVKDYTEEYHAKFHEEVFEILEACDYVWGTYVWNMFTFAADQRDEGGVKGLNNKGLVSFDRKTRKDAFYYYKAKWNKEPMVHLNSKRFVDRHNKGIILKAYSNLGEVQFFLNNELVDTVKEDGVIFTTNVTLKEGTNFVKVIAGGLEDSTTFVTVDEPNSDYQVPTSEEGKGIFNIEDAGNWFDTLLDEDAELLPFDPTCFSTKDPIGDIIATEAGLALFTSVMPSFMEHPMFEMAKGFSIDMIRQFDTNALPDALIQLLSKELQKIKK